jgi:hypothetical protein
MKKFKIPALIPTLALLPITIFLATLNLANANSSEDNPLPFLPPFQHSQSQSQSHAQLQPPPQQLQPQQQQQINQHSQKQPLNSNILSNGHKNQFDNHSPTVTSVMPF